MLGFDHQYLLPLLYKLEKKRRGWCGGLVQPKSKLSWGQNFKMHTCPKPDPPTSKPNHVGSRRVHLNPTHSIHCLELSVTGRCGTRMVDHRICGLHMPIAEKPAACIAPRTIFYGSS